MGSVLLNPRAWPLLSFQDSVFGSGSLLSVLTLRVIMSDSSMQMLSCSAGEKRELPVCFLTWGRKFHTRLGSSSGSSMPPHVSYVCGHVFLCACIGVCQYPCTYVWASLWRVCLSLILHFMF